MKLNKKLIKKKQKKLTLANQDNPIEKKLK
jgi:hypothetical protein